MTTRPGWFQASPIGPRSLSPQKLPLFGPIFHESFVKRSIAVRVLVRLMSPRTLSSRQLTGTLKLAVKLFVAQGSGFVGLGYAWSRTCAAGLSRSAGITLGVGKPGRFAGVPAAGSC